MCKLKTQSCGLEFCTSYKTNTTGEGRNGKARFIKSTTLRKTSEPCVRIKNEWPTRFAFGWLPLAFPANGVWKWHMEESNWQPVYCDSACLTTTSRHHFIKKAVAKQATQHNVIQGTLRFKKLKMEAKVTMHDWTGMCETLSRVSAAPKSSMLCSYDTWIIENFINFT